MANYIIIHIYVDKNKNMILVPYKLCKVGYAVATEPYEKVSHTEWEKVSVHIVDLLRKIEKEPFAEDTRTQVMKQICGSQGFKQFSKKHICITAMYLISEKSFMIGNRPRLSDGSYGIEKDTISEMYSIDYTSTDNIAEIQENFMKAYGDAERYLEKIGAKL